MAFASGRIKMANVICKNCGEWVHGCFNDDILILKSKVENLEEKLDDMMNLVKAIVYNPDSVIVKNVAKKYPDLGLTFDEIEDIEDIEEN